MNKYMRKYNTEDITKCEYKYYMVNAVYSKEPKIINDKCCGFKNPYDGRVSKVCDKCTNLLRD